MNWRTVSEGLAVAAACACACVDLRTKKIPNQLTLPAAVAGMVINLIFGGFSGLLTSLLGRGAGFACVSLWFVGGLKAGDVKLYMAVGALGGWRYAMNAIMYSILIGGGTAFFLMLSRKSGRTSLKNLWNYCFNMWLTRRFWMYEGNGQSSYFCFGSCIAAGAIAAMIWRII